MAGQGNARYGNGSMSYVVPNYVLDEPYDHNKVHQRTAEYQYQFKNPVEAFHMQSKTYNLKVQHRGRFHANWTFAGPGMQAIFLDSGRRSCGGTGVFLPQHRRVGTDAPNASKKPACALRVFMPARVVEALNINVHELNFQLSHNNSMKSKGRKEDQTSIKSTKDDNEDMLSPEILLPKEWTY